MSQTQTYKKEWEEHEKPPNQKDRKVHETPPNEEEEWIQKQTQFYQKLRKEHKKEEESRLKSKKIEPIVITNHFNYTEYDIKAMVDKVLTKNEFSDDSSIFMVVPSVDNDSEKSYDGQTSSICIQMSLNSAKWKTKVNPVQNDPKQRRNGVATHRGMKISAKGNRFFMGPIPIQILSFHNKETLFKHEHPMPKDSEKKATKNKLCQIVTPTEIVEKPERNVVSTDTADRPCCCNPNKTQYSDCSQNDRYVATVMSRLVTPLLERGIIGNPFHIRWGMKQQDSVMSVTVPPSSGRKLPCKLHHHAEASDQCLGNHALNPGNPAQCPADSTQHHAKAPEEYPTNSAKHHAEASSAQKRTNLSQMQPCECNLNLEKMLELLKLAVKEGKTQHMQSVGCGEPPQSPKAQAPEPPLAVQSPIPERMQIEMGETKRKRVCIKETKFSSSVGTSTEPKLFRRCKNGKKSHKKVACKCSQHALESEPGTEQYLEPHLILGPYYQQDEFEDTLKKNSEDSLRVSGFKIIQKKRPPVLQPEYTLEDALRYYAMKNPELFKSIMAEQQASIDNQECTPPSSPGDNSGLEETPSDSQDEEGPFKGLKFKIGAKGSGSQGLAGICCFDLLQESFTTW